MRDRWRPGGHSRHLPRPTPRSTRALAHGAIASTHRRALRPLSRGSTSFSVCRRSRRGRGPGGSRSDTLFAGGGVVDGQLGGVEERTLHLELRASLPVDRVADERMVDRTQVHADLMGAAGLEPTLEQGELGRAVETARRVRYSVRAQRPSATTAIRNGSRRDRPIGASITPCGGRRGVPTPAPEIHTGGLVIGELLDQRIGGRPAYARQRANQNCRHRADARCPGRCRLADVDELGIAGQQTR